MIDRSSPALRFAAVAGGVTIGADDAVSGRSVVLGFMLGGKNLGDDIGLSEGGAEVFEESPFNDGGFGDVGGRLGIPSGTFGSTGTTAGGPRNGGALDFDEDGPDGNSTAGGNVTDGGSVTEGGVSGEGVDPDDDVPGSVTLGSGKSVLGGVAKFVDGPLPERSLLQESARGGVPSRNWHKIRSASSSFASNS